MSTSDHETVACSFAQLEDGTVVLYPQDESVRDGLREFQEGKYLAQWIPWQSRSGAAYDLLWLDFTQDGESFGVALMPPAEAQTLLELPVVRRAFIALSEPTGDFGVERLDGIQVELPAYPSASN